MGDQDISSIIVLIFVLGWKLELALGPVVKAVEDLEARTAIRVVLVIAAAAAATTTTTTTDHKLRRNRSTSIFIANVDDDSLSYPCL
jgi:hypothetical protein